MKSSGSRPQPAPQDEGAAAFGLAAADLSPAVRSLLGEIEALRGEVGRLKSRLSVVEQLADRDALTPLLNRRAFLRELARVNAFARRYGAPASLVFLDLDGFKQINDRFGHAAGDTALRVVAERLVANVRESDVAARLGGDEFALILVQADQATAQAKAQALVQAIEAEPLSFGAGSAQLRVSFGVRQLDAATSPEELLASADAAMFARKRAVR